MESRRKEPRVGRKPHCRQRRARAVVVLLLVLLWPLWVFGCVCCVGL